MKSLSGIAMNVTTGSSLTEKPSNAEDARTLSMIAEPVKKTLNTDSDA